jgi:hypothetical protein
MKCPSTLQAKLQEIGITPPNKENLKLKLLEISKVSGDAFDKYHQSTKDYRDRNLIHREHSPQEIKDGDLHYPIIAIANKTFLSLTMILIQLIKSYPNSPDSAHAYKLIYDDVGQKEQIIQLIEESIPKFIGEVTL